MEEIKFDKRGLGITNEEYDERLKSLELNVVRIEEYVNSKTSILHKCLLCKKESKIYPKAVSSFKCLCEKKSILREKNKAEYLESIKDKNIELIGEYISAVVKTDHKCKNCENIWSAKPYKVKEAKVGCPNCSGKKFTHEHYTKLLPRDIVVSEGHKYEGTHKYLEHKCLNCNRTWNPKPGHILYNKCGCPYCAASKGEKSIRNFLEDNNIDFVSEKHVKIEDRNFFFDFYVDSMNLYIEYDGKQHFESIEYFGGEDQFEIIQQNDDIKNGWIIDNGYNLLRISYLEDVNLKMGEYFNEYRKI